MLHWFFYYLVDDSVNEQFGDLSGCLKTLSNDNNYYERVEAGIILSSHLFTFSRIIRALYNYNHLS